MGREFELKYRADREILATLAAQFGPFDRITMETTYYDTPDRALGSRRWTLRRRYENGISVCTVKTPGVNGSRGEWETECDDIHRAITPLIAIGAPEELAVLTEKGVVEVCGARFTRLAATLQQEDCIAELALDEGFLLGGGQALPFFEVEVELKDGAEDATVRLAQDLAVRFGLEPEPKSKLQRALELSNKGETENGES